MLRNVFKELKTTAAAIVILIVWAVSAYTTIPPQVQTAMIAILGAIFLGLSKDPTK